MANLAVNGRHVGEEIQAGQSAQGDRGSIIMLLATDIPLSERQLRRLCRRAGPASDGQRSGAFHAAECRHADGSQNRSTLAGGRLRGMKRRMSRRKPFRA